MMLRYALINDFASYGRGGAMQIYVFLKRALLERCRRAITKAKFSTVTGPAAIFHFFEYYNELCLGHLAITV